MEIAKVLVLSTSHLTRETADLLNHGPEPPWGPEFARDEGWMFYADHDFANGAPPELLAAFKLARKHKCVWVMFDRDGPREEALPWHEW